MSRAWPSSSEVLRWRRQRFSQPEKSSMFVLSEPLLSSQLCQFFLGHPCPARVMSSSPSSCLLFSQYRLGNHQCQFCHSFSLQLPRSSCIFRPADQAASCFQSFPLRTLSANPSSQFQKTFLFFPNQKTQIPNVLVNTEICLPLRDKNFQSPRVGHNTISPQKIARDTTTNRQQNLCEVK